MRRSLPLLLVVAILAVGLFFFLNKKEQPAPEPAPAPTPIFPTGPALSTLATTPDWAQLEAFQGTVTREQFLTSLTQVSALPDAWEPVVTIEDDAAWVRHHMGPDSGESKIPFAIEPTPLAPLPPLQQLHIAIDPGHIGGDFAHLEQRNFQPFPDDPDQVPIREGDLTLATAKHLKPLLEKLGATVTLVRETNEPVTTKRPQDFLPDFPDRLTAEKVFYRTAEIHARADIVNNVIQPDLVLCLHYNADGWTDPENPWASRNHFHVLMHGAYMPGEVTLDDQRFEMLRHLYTQSTQRALPLAKLISDVFLRETDLVPYHYIPAAPALHVDPVRPIYARNLLANRLYEAPTIFLEPYVMNHRDTYDRVQLGDYPGFQEFKGKERRSLVQEYAHTLASAIAEFYLNPLSNNHSMSRHLLVAGNGYLGQAVSEQARALNWTVTTLSKSGENSDHAADFTDPQALQDLAKEIAPPTHILASASSGRGGPEAYQRVFIDGTTQLLKAFPDAHLTFISSTSVYRQTDGSTVTEESELAGETATSAILRQAEELTLAANGTALRLSGIYGPNRSIILKKFLNNEATLEETTHGLGVRILNQIHRDDAARAILHLITKEQSGLFNVTDNQPTSQLETYQQLSQKLSKPLPPVAPPNPNSKRGWTHKAISNAKLRTTGWSPTYPNFLSAIDDLLANPKTKN